MRERQNLKSELHSSVLFVLFVAGLLQLQQQETGRWTADLMRRFVHVAVMLTSGLAGSQYLQEVDPVQTLLLN